MLAPYIAIYNKQQQQTNDKQQSIMTRTQKWQEHEGASAPKWFTHNGHVDQDPTKVKKSGAGKGNWGAAGSEIEDLIDQGEIPPMFNKARRGSNNSQHEKKYEQLDFDVSAISEAEDN